MRILFLLFFASFLTPRNCSMPASDSNCEVAQEKRISGLNFTAPSNPFPKDPMPAVQEINAEWIAVIPYGYSKKGESNVSFNTGWQWWGEKVVGIKETIRLAKASNIKVMVKPQVYIPGGWVGQMDFSNEEDWLQWEKTYSDFILTFAKVAAEQNAELFCVGTEYEIAAQKRAPFWRALIKEVRKLYPGKLVYAANWDGFEKVPFWKDLDYVGIDAYFPLSKEKTPTIKTLKEAWKGPVEKIEKFYCTIEKPILFTEFGYLSVDGCAFNTWELEKGIRSHPINEQAQANALEALFQVFDDQAWWGGGFLWKWFPNHDGHEGYPTRDYTPQGKLAAKTVNSWYGKFNAGIK